MKYKDKYETELGTLYLGDCRDILPHLPPADALITDPPYGTQSLDWDKSYASTDQLIELIRWLRDESLRAVADNGTLVVFMDEERAAAVQLCLQERWHLLNRCTWSKGIMMPVPVADLRSFFPSTEAILIFEKAEADKAFELRSDAMHGRVMAPLIDYLRAVRARILALHSWTPVDFRAFMKKATGAYWVADRHYFGPSQFELPTEPAWQAMMRLIPEHEDLRREHEDLRREHDDLRREYDDLRKEYDDLRRYFNAPEDGFLDLFADQPVSRSAERAIHPTQKPVSLMRKLVSATVRPGGVCYDPFAGSGSTLVACEQLGRRWVGIEQDPAFFAGAVARLQATTTDLFTD